MKRNRDIYGHTAPSNIAFAIWLAKTCEMPSPSRILPTGPWLYFPQEGHPYEATLEHLHNLWLNEPFTS